MKRLIMMAVLMLGTAFSSFGQRYYLPVPIASNNGKPLTDKTVALYDSTGATSKYSCRWDKGAVYYTTSQPIAGFYDVKLYNAGTWLTLYDNIKLNYAVTIDYDSLKAYLLVDSTTMRWVGDSLAVYSIDSSEITNASITNNKIKAAPAYNYVLASVSPYGYAVWSKIDSSMITNYSISGVDLANTIFTFQPDSGITLNGYSGASLTYSPSMTFNLDTYVDDDTAFAYETRKLVLRDGGTNTGIKYQKFNQNVWDTLTHFVADYYYIATEAGYIDYNSDSIYVVDTLALDAAQYYGTYTEIQSTGTDAANNQAFSVYVMCDPKDYQYLLGGATGDPAIHITIAYRSDQTDSSMAHWTVNFYNLTGTSVVSAGEYYYAGSANTWLTKTFTTSGIDLSDLLNDPFMVKISGNLVTTDVHSKLDFAYIKFEYQTR